MKIIMTGATGLVGRALTRALLASGHEVEAWTRSTEKASFVLPARCSIFQWDPMVVDPARLAGADAVIHLAGENIAGGRWTARRKKALESSRIDSARALVNAMASLPAELRPKHFLSASAIGLYGDRGDEKLHEEVAPGEGFMPRLCADWEAAAFEAESLGIRTAALRIGIVLDRHDGMLPTVLPLFRLGLAGRIGSGRQWMSWIHIDDVVGLFLHVLQREDIRGAVNAAAPNPVRNAEFTRVLAATLGRPAFLPAPAFALRIAVGEMAAVMTASQRLVVSVAERTGFSFRHPTLADALAQLCSEDAHLLITERYVDVPLERAFEFFSDAQNLEKITPPFLRFAITSPPDGPLRKGSRIAYKIRLHGVPIRWRTMIDQWNPPHDFVDRQEKGPYDLWHHTHELERCGRGTLVRDRVRYRLPFGTIGDLVAGRWVARDIERIFTYRRERLPELLPSSFLLTSNDSASSYR